MTPTSILVTWEPPTPVYGVVLMYTILYSSSVNNGGVNAEAEERSVTLTGLMEYVNYTITVYAFTDKGRGQGSSIFQRTREHSKGLCVCSY